MDVTIQQLLAMTLGSVWGQLALFGVTVASIAADRGVSLKGIPAAIVAKWTAWRAGNHSTDTPTQRTACENRRTTLVGIRHKASEMPPGEERDKALALCDEMDKLASSLWPEAA